MHLGIPGYRSRHGLRAVAVFAFLFGVSMDYEVFIVARVKEAHDAGRSTDEAIVESWTYGPPRHERGDYLFLAFAALASGPNAIKVFATGMGVGILWMPRFVRAYSCQSGLLLGRRIGGLPFTHRASSPASEE